jgi:hypothetical protein
VVLEVGGADVGDAAAEGLELVLHGGGECYWGEDGEVAGGEFGFCLLVRVFGTEGKGSAEDEGGETNQLYLCHRLS